jgi:hypothetical protein
VAASLTLTAKGARKLELARERVLAAVQRGLRREVTRARAAAAAAAPSPEEEARLLSRGVTVGGNLSGQTLGTPDGGRFLREGMMPVQRAIATDAVVVETAGPIVMAATGSSAEINAKTGFFWRTRKRGIQGPTYPFNRNYLRALEDGGAVWVVVPRPGTKALEPEPTVIARRMVKTVPPFQMYQQARIGRDAEMRSKLSQDVRQSVRSLE